MDPDVAVTTMRDENANPEDRIKAANNLLGWLGSGGYVPAGYDDRSGQARKLAQQECREFLKFNDKTVR